MLSIKKYNKTNTMKYRTEAAGVTALTENNRNEAHCNDKEDIFTLLHTYTLKRTLRWYSTVANVSAKIQTKHFHC